LAQLAESAESEAVNLAKILHSAPQL
jgi:hypothetical protein